MQPTLCSRCKKNVAVVFITRLDNPEGPGRNEGLCLKCARELNIRPVTDMIEKMGLTDEDLDVVGAETQKDLRGVGFMVAPVDGGRSGFAGKSGGGGGSL